MNKLQKFYHKSPFWLKNILVSAYGYVQFKKRYSGDLVARLHTIEKATKYTRSEIEMAQLRQFKELFYSAVSNVPYYKKNYGKYLKEVMGSTSLDIMGRLPIIDKHIVRDNYEDFLSATEKPYIIQSTSGSTGSSLSFALNKPTYQLSMAMLINHENTHGILFKAPRASFNGRMLKPIEDIAPPHWVYNKSENQKLFSSYHLDESTFASYDRELNNFSPEELIGYPSVIYELALLYKKLDVKPNYNLKAIITNSETLMDWQRAVIESVFSANIYDYYGSAEYVLFSSQCKSFKYHIDPSLGIIETVDEQGYNCSEAEGEVIATTLTNTAMPLIRYRIGDNAIMSSTNCDCGKKTSFLRQIVGRVDDILIAADGRHIGRTGEVFGYFKNVKEAQIIQETALSIQLLVCLLDKNQPIDELKLIKVMKEKVGFKMQVKVKYIDAIPRNANGKFRTVVNSYLHSLDSNR